MLGKSNDFFFDSHEHDDDIVDEKTGEPVRPQKEFYCRNCSKRKRLEKERAEAVAEGASEEEIAAIDERIAEQTPVVVPTTTLLPAYKFVGVVAPTQPGQRRRKVVLEVDPTDQEQRMKQGEEAREKIKVKREQDDATSVASGSVVEGRNGAASLAGSKRRAADSLDADVESIDSSDDDASADSKPKRRRLRKIKESSKLQLSNGNGSSRASAAASSSVAAASSPVVAAAASGADPVPMELDSDVHVSSASTPQMRVRSGVRSQLTELLGQPGVMQDPLSIRVEAALWTTCGPRALDLYKERARSLLYNLKKNAELRMSLQSGSLPPDEFVRMDDAAMATPAAKDRRAAASEQALREHISAPQVVLMNKEGQPVAIDPTTGQRTSMPVEEEEE
jgi:hypothetical protein